MVNYEYKVTSFQLTINAADVLKGQADAKLSAQLEQQLALLSKQGWEFYSQLPVDVKVTKGCLATVPVIGGFFGGGLADEVTLMALIFRREVR